MSGQPFIKFYPSDWLGGTRGLSAAEAGVYITLVCQMYEHEGALAYDEGRLARQCGAPKAAFTKALRSLIDLGKVELNDGILTNARVKKELCDLANRRENGRVAADRRWSAQEDKNEENQRPSDAAALPGQCVADAKPEARYQKEYKKEASPPPRVKASREVGRPEHFPDFIRPEVAESFLVHRKLHKAPMTKRAIEQLGRELTEIRDMGRDPNGALDYTMLRGWRSINADWVRNAIANKKTTAPETTRALTDEERAERDMLLAKIGRTA